MIKRFAWMAALAVMILACGPLTEAVDSIEEDTVSEQVEDATGGEDQPAAEEPAAEGPAAPAEFDYQGVDFDSFDSYEVQISIAFRGTTTEGEDANLDVSVSLAEQTEPRASQLNIEFAGAGAATALDLDAGNEGSIGIYEVEGISYAELATGDDPFCFGSAITEGEEATPADDFLGEDGLDLDNIEGDFELVEAGVEVNGVMTNHYRDDSIDDADFSEATADVYVAQDEGYVVRLVIEGTGSFDDGFNEGDLTLTYNLLSVNQPVEVVVPDYCETFDLPDEDGEEGSTDS